MSCCWISPDHDPRRGFRVHGIHSFGVQVHTRAHLRKSAGVIRRQWPQAIANVAQQA